MVPFGFMIDCRLASCPTRRSPFSVKATTEGVVRAPSALGITIGSPPCQAAITEIDAYRCCHRLFLSVAADEELQRTIGNLQVRDDVVILRSQPKSGNP